jgi:hypothetical protein
MRSLLAISISCLLLTHGWQASLAYTLQRAESSGTVRWHAKRIRFALSSSFFSAPNVQGEPAEIVLATRKALAHWAKETGIQFSLAISSAQSVSGASSGGDRLNLITVASTAENLALFEGEGDLPSRVRVFFQPQTGAIVEADIALNPNILFSTDGTPGTYDLEATLIHEFGHALGLSHSAVIGSIMQPRLPMNGDAGHETALRRLAEDDRAAARALYRPRTEWGSLIGKVSFNNGYPVFGAHVFVEDIATGRIAASDISREDGSYRIDGLPAGEYRVGVEPLDGPIEPAEIFARSTALNVSNDFRSFVSDRAVEVNANSLVEFNIKLEDVPPKIDPRALGLNGKLSTAPLALAPGRTYTLSIGGEGLDEIVEVASDSPYLVVEGINARGEGARALFPVLDLRVRIGADAPTGEYSLRLRSREGEVAWIVGALIVERQVALDGAKDGPEIETDLIELD